jgi:hypothetical protein
MASRPETTKGALMSRLLASLVALGIAMGGARAAEPPKPPGKVDFPNLRLDLKANTVEFDGTFLRGDYPLELLVTIGTMRDYESLITTPCKASHLHFALLALGLKPIVRDKKDPGRITRQGDRVQVLLRYKEKGKVVTRPPHELIRDVKEKKPLSKLPWIFYGSMWYPTGTDKNKLDYLGDAEGAVIGLLGEARCVIDVRQNVSLKYGMLEIAPDETPAKGTKVTVVIRPAKENAEGKPEQAPGDS